MRSASFCVLLLASAAWAGPPMDSANNQLVRNVVNGGGAAATSTSNTSLTGSVGEPVVIMSETSSSNQAVKAGFSEIASFPGVVLSLTPGADITTSSVTLTWVTPGYDGGLGVAQAGSAYLVQLASSTNFGNTLATFDNLNTIAVTISTSGSTIGKVVGSGVASLDPDTTYYSQVFLRDSDGDISLLFTTSFTTFNTLAAPPTVGALEFLSVQSGSVTVAWLAPTQPTISSMSNQGYTLWASSNDFGAVGPAGAPLFSSTTYNVLGTTLTLSIGAGGVPLDLSNTYYFQVAALNSVGASSFTAFTRLNFQIQQSTNYFYLGAMNPLIAQSTVSVSSMIVTNVGNWPVTLQLSASTATVGGSPWTLGTVPGVEQPTLEGELYGGPLGPTAASFNSFITASTATATASVYAGNQTGVQFPSGTTRTLWVHFTLPTSSVSLGPERMKVLAGGVYP